MGRPARSPGWGGTIAAWELTRLARRGAPTVARLLVALLLFAALFVAYLAEFPRYLDVRDPAGVQQQLSEFGQQFSLAFLLVQAGVVLLVTPLFVAGAIVEESERRTLEFLIATDLNTREIVLGKLWPRLLLVVGVIIAGWPVLAATQVWGGVDILFVAVSSLVILSSTWAVAGISAACSIGAPSLRKAMVKSYLWSFLCLGLPICTCPFGVIATLADASAAFSEYGSISAQSSFGRSAAPRVLIFVAGVLVLHVAAHFLVGLCGIVRACRKLPNAALSRGRYVARQQMHKLQHWEKHPPVPQGSPLIWKELNLSGQATRFVRLLSLVPWVVWLCVCSVMMVVGWAAVIGSSDDILQRMNDLIRWGGGAVVMLMCLVVGLHAASSVARERQQETLDDLMTIPRPRREILWAKWVGSMSKARAIALGSLAVPLVGVIGEGLSLWAVVPLLLAAFVFVGCAASFGLWLSVRAHSVQRVTGLWLLIVILWLGGTMVAAQAAYVEQRSDIQYAFRSGKSEIAPLWWDRILNPLLAWSELSFRLRDDEQPYYLHRGDGAVRSLVEVLPSLAGLAFFAGFGWLLYQAAVRRFEREGRG